MPDVTINEAIKIKKEVEQRILQCINYGLQEFEQRTGIKKYDVKLSLSEIDEVTDVHGFYITVKL